LCLFRIPHHDRLYRSQPPLYTEARHHCDYLTQRNPITVWWRLIAFNSRSGQTLTLDNGTLQILLNIDRALRDSCSPAIEHWLLDPHGHPIQQPATLNKQGLCQLHDTLRQR
jgi:hypothetical protein